MVRSGADPGQRGLPSWRLELGDNDNERVLLPGVGTVFLRSPTQVRRLVLCCIEELQRLGPTGLVHDVYFQSQGDRDGLVLIGASRFGSVRDINGMPLVAWNVEQLCYAVLGYYRQVEVLLGGPPPEFRVLDPHALHMWLDQTILSSLTRRQGVDYASFYRVFSSLPEVPLRRGAWLDLYMVEQAADETDRLEPAV